MHFPLLLLVSAVNDDPLGVERCQVGGDTDSQTIPFRR